MARKLEERGLVRQFYDILDDNSLNGGSGKSIRLSDIEPRRDQPRKTFEKEASKTSSVTSNAPVSRETSVLLSWKAGKQCKKIKSPPRFPVASHKGILI